MKLKMNGLIKYENMYKYYLNYNIINYFPNILVFTAVILKNKYINRQIDT